MKLIRVIILVMMMIDIHCQKNVKSINAIYYRKYDLSQQRRNAIKNDSWRLLSIEKTKEFIKDYDDKKEISPKAVDNYLQSAKCVNYLKIVFQNNVKDSFYLRGNILMPEKGNATFFYLKEPCSFYFSDYTVNIEPDTGDAIQRHIRKIDSLDNLGK